MEKASSFLANFRDFLEFLSISFDLFTYLPVFEFIISVLVVGVILGIIFGFFKR